MSKTDYAAFKQDLFKLQTDLEEDIEAAFENQDLENGVEDLKSVKEMLEEKFILPAGFFFFFFLNRPYLFISPFFLSFRQDL